MAVTPHRQWHHLGGDTWQTNHWCTRLRELQVAERGSTRYEVLFQVAAGQSERDTWHLACVSTRSECVSTRSECVNPCQSWDNEAVGRRQKRKNALIGSGTRTRGDKGYGATDARRNPFAAIEMRPDKAVMMKFRRA
ncbi:hypothetical protein Tco_0925627 [Tanacetum coccineum]|uniref:Uncharacterized protein n=1 Tax=Tanacetum coccineum TaxID=301880 RepID=A0ABQ5D9D5_9ASTR